MVSAWDLPTRLFHWLLVLGIVSAFVSFRFSGAFGDNLLKWHRWNGLAILVLLTWRVLWGFAGSSTSRFSGFVKGPGAALRYARDLTAGRDRHYLGHNPLGTFMVLALLAVAITQGLLGLFTVEHNDLTAGPLYRLISEEGVKQASRWHRWLFYWVLLPAIAVHITANILYGMVKKHPLIPAMITGKKPAANYADGAEASLVERPLLRAFICLLVAKAIVFAPIYLASGKLI